MVIFVFFFLVCDFVCLGGYLVVGLIYCGEKRNVLWFGIFLGLMFFIKRKDSFIF